MSGFRPFNPAFTVIKSLYHSAVFSLSMPTASAPSAAPGPTSTAGGTSSTVYVLGELTPEAAAAGAGATDTVLVLGLIRPGRAINGADMDSFAVA